MTERLVVRIVWADDHEDSVLDVKLSPYARQIIAELEAQGVDPAEIARRLNEKGLVTTQGNPWTRDTVAHYIRSPRLKRP